jgi:hypothetical protein
MISSKCTTANSLLIIGYTTRRHLLLDLDNTSEDKVNWLANMIMDEWPEVGDCLVLCSSESPLQVELKYSWDNRPWIRVTRSNYHLVFDNIIGYNKACKIIETLEGLNILQRDYSKIRAFRGDMTLRVSEAALSTGVKPAPKKVMWILQMGNKMHDRMIDEYLVFRDAALSLASRELHAEDEADYGAYGTNYSCKEGPVHVLVKSDGL